MTETSSLAIILAAGKGTRMKSALPKVLHKLAGAPMIAHVLDAAQAAGVAKLALVVAPGMEEVAQAATSLDRKLEVFVQPGQLGTADAVKAARQALEDFKGHVLILYGDTPLLRPETLNAAAAELA
jgi:bifunctional UDP-N-acetylglucosamine pyrophosphorylase/glucosamine-1-phosphate N-acetyltransferase